MRKLIGLVAKRKREAIDQVLNNPLEIMEERLLEIISRHSDTMYGREHDFESLTSSEKFKERVPLSDSKTLKKYWEMTYENPGGGILTVDPIVWYLQTSGTTGVPKNIPISAQGIKDVAKGSMLGWMGFLAQDPENSKIVDGKTFRSF